MRLIPVMPLTGVWATTVKLAAAVVAADPVLRPKSTSEPVIEIFSIQQIAGNSAGYVYAGRLGGLLANEREVVFYDQVLQPSVCWLRYYVRRPQSKRQYLRREGSQLLTQSPNCPSTTLLYRDATI